MSDWVGSKRKVSQNDESYFLVKTGSQSEVIEKSWVFNMCHVEGSVKSLNVHILTNQIYTTSGVTWRVDCFLPNRDSMQYKNVRFFWKCPFWVSVKKNSIFFGSCGICIKSGWCRIELGPKGKLLRMMRGIFWWNPEVNRRSLRKVEFSIWAILGGLWKPDFLVLRLYTHLHWGGTPGELTGFCRIEIRCIGKNTKIGGDAHFECR